MNKIATMIYENIDNIVTLYKFNYNNKDYLFINKELIEQRNILSIEECSLNKVKVYISNILLDSKNIPININENNSSIYYLDSFNSNNGFIKIDEYIYLVKEYIKINNIDYKRRIYIYDKNTTLEDINNNHDIKSKFSVVSYFIYKLTQDDLIFLDYYLSSYYEEIDKKYYPYIVNLKVKEIPYNKFEYTIFINKNKVYKFINNELYIYDIYKNTSYTDKSFLQIYFREELDKAIDIYHNS